MIRKGWAAMLLSERRGPLCRGPDCFTENGPCHPGCTPDARAVHHKPVMSGPKHAHSTNGSFGAQWRYRLRRFVVWVLLAASLVAALSTLAHGVHTLIDLISKVP
jgi:hypothetical protein